MSIDPDTPKGIIEILKRLNSTEDYSLEFTTDSSDFLFLPYEYFIDENYYSWI